MILPESDPPQRSADWLRFACAGCGYELEAPRAYAGVEGPCPVCGVPVRAPEVEQAPVEPRPDAAGDAVMVKAKGSPERLHLPPLDDERERDDFAAEVPMEEDVTAAAPAYVSPDVGQPVNDRLELRPLHQDAPELEPVPEPLPIVLPEGRRKALATREEEEAAETVRVRKKELSLRLFDAALLLLFAGTLVMGGAAVAFTQSKSAATPAASPELSRQVMQRMEQTGRERDQAVQDAREVVQHWLTAETASAVKTWCLPGEPAPAIPGTSGVDSHAGSGIPEFDFIRARRLPGTDRFLTMFEVLSDPPMVVPVEETPGGPRLHSRAIVQQQSGALAGFLASQGHGEAVFYVLLRPGPPSMAEELVRARPDLKLFLHVAVEPAFPADGASACLACMAPNSEAAAIFAKRVHDPGLRPAVVKLAWRQHRESGNYVELVSFEPNAWSQH